MRIPRLDRPQRTACTRGTTRTRRTTTRPGGWCGSGGVGTEKAAAGPMHDRYLTHPIRLLRYCHGRVLLSAENRTPAGEAVPRRTAFRPLHRFRAQGED